MSLAQAVSTWTVDTQAPETILVSQDPATSPTALTTMVATFVSSEGGVVFECQLDGAAYASCSSPVTYTQLSDGNHVLNIRSVDSAGNVDLSPVVVQWTVDTLPFVVSDVTISSITRTGAVISWTTNKLATRQVRYVKEATQEVFFTTVDYNLSTTHSVTLTGLTANTLYSTQGLSQSWSGQTGQTPVKTFRTTR